SNTPAVRASGWWRGRRSPRSTGSRNTSASRTGTRRRRSRKPWTAWTRSPSPRDSAARHGRGDGLVAGGRGVDVGVAAEVLQLAHLRDRRRDRAVRRVLDDVGQRLVAAGRLGDVDELRVDLVVLRLQGLVEEVAEERDRQAGEVMSVREGRRH